MEVVPLKRSWKDIRTRASTQESIELIATVAKIALWESEYLPVAANTVELRNCLGNLSISRALLAA